MSDLISRQAAIDCVNHMRFGMDLMAFGIVTTALLELPSAQPEIVRCRDCKYGELDDDRWYCRSLGCQIGNEDGSGFCADAERRE